MMDRLPPELVVRVLMQLEPENLSRCDQLSRRFHGLTSIAEKALGLIMHIESDELLQERFHLWYGQQHSLVEEALRRLATDGGYTLPETLPSNHVSWTQALLFLAMLRRDSNRQRVAATRPRSMSIDDDGPDDGPFRESSAFLDADGTLLMCGANPKYHARELCRGQEIRQNIPASIAGFTGVRVQSIAASSKHTIVLAVDGTAYSWGKGREGALGHGDIRDLAQPTRIRALSNVCAIATGDSHALAITADGSVWSWGSLDVGCFLLGHGDVFDVPSAFSTMLPKRIEALAGLRICAVSAGDGHSLAACADRGCFSWGMNFGHALGLRSPEIELLPHFEDEPDAEEAYAPVPHRVHALSYARVRSCAASDRCSCAVDAQGEIWRWGIMHDTDVYPAGLLRTPLACQRVVSVALSGFHALAVTADGALFSWWLRNAFLMDIEVPMQRGTYDLLGHGDAYDAPSERVCSPRLIEALAGHRICSIAACSTHSIAAGWTNTAAGDAPGPEGPAEWPQWACWSWGVTLPTERQQNRLGLGEYHATTNLPRRVMGIGGNQSGI